ncbi:DUF6069 family protein [Curtobacterium sp. MCBA15_008]|uniref:DUF6069 family protein n=1 Tax=Curtobacterium sp. MCBA15_008 TaxID=1898736 RepID=UPI0008DE2CBE|nr:hypothetical protein BIU96_14730 [Curtobacterium sp. MCBA15_008]
MTQARTATQTTKRGFIAVILAMSAAGACWAIGTVAMGHEPDAGGATIGLAQVLIVTAAVGLVAWASRAVVARWASRWGRAWLLATAGIGAVSLIGPLTLARDGSAPTLLLLHVAVAAILCAGLAGRSLGRTGQRGEPVERPE